MGRCIELTFSPTGGTRKVADEVARSLADEVVWVDLTDPGADFSAVEIRPDDVAVVAAPCFVERIPPVVIERVGQVRGAGAACVPICVYGNRGFKDSLRELADAAQKAGFCVAAGIAAVAQSSITSEYATGRPDATDIGRLRGFGEKVAAALADGAPLDCAPIPGTSPRKDALVPPMVPRYQGSCSHCGACATSCPTEAIDAVTLTADRSRCMACLRCVAQCPDNARQVNALVRNLVVLAIRRASVKRKECALYSA